MSVELVCLIALAACLGGLFFRLNRLFEDVARLREQVNGERERLSRELAELRSQQVARRAFAPPPAAPTGGEDVLARLRNILADSAELEEDSDDEPTPQNLRTARLA